MVLEEKINELKIKKVLEVSDINYLNINRYEIKKLILEQKCDPRFFLRTAEKEYYKKYKPLYDLINYGKITKIIPGIILI